MTGDFQVHFSALIDRGEPLDFADPDRSRLYREILPFSSQLMGSSALNVNGGNERRRLKATAVKGKKFSIKQLFGDVTPRFLRQKLALAVTGVRLHSQPNTDPVAFGKRHGIAADTC
ncbi:MAG: hypothetical protein PHF19_02645 [Synergistales bacterium]|nr:hypothetical protein [Synergistales bacterium]